MDLTLGQKVIIVIPCEVLEKASILLLEEFDGAIEYESRRVVQEALDTLLIGIKITI